LTGFVIAPGGGTKTGRNFEICQWPWIVRIEADSDVEN
jgi:hypothetical protein